MSEPVGAERGDEKALRAALVPGQEAPRQTAGRLLSDHLLLVVSLEITLTNGSVMAVTNPPTPCLNRAGLACCMRAEQVGSLLLGRLSGWS